MRSAQPFPAWLLRSCSFILLLLFCVAAFARAGDSNSQAAETARPGITITYLGNEGFLLQSGGKKVLVDALQGPGLQGYVTLPPARRDTLEQSQPPFDGVSLVLASHFHADHFDARSVARYLEHNPAAVFVSTEQAVAKLLQKSEDLRSRAHAFHPDAGDRIRMPLQGLGLEVMSFHHGSGGTQNLGLIVEMDGIKVLHVGDTEATPAEFVDYGMAGEQLSVAFVPFWFLFESGWQEAIAGARHVVAMHLPARDAPPSYFGSSANLDKLMQKLRAIDPDVVLFERLLERRTLPVKAAGKSKGGS